MSITYFDAYTRIGPLPRSHRAHPWTLDHLIAELDHCSISGALVASTAQIQYDAMLENRRLSERLAPHDNLFPIWNVLPHWTDECPAPDPLIRLLAQNNVRAVSIYPVTNGWDPLSRTSQPLFQALQDAGLLVIADVSTELQPSHVESLCEAFPRLNLLMRAAAWAKQRYFHPLMLRYKNLHVEFDTYQINRGLEWLVAHGCEDQLLFASNAPSMAAGAHRAYVDWSDVPHAAKQKIASGNLIRLLRGLKPPREIVNKDEDELMAAVRRGEPLPCLTLDTHAHMLDEGLNGAGGGYTMFNGGPTGTRELARRMGVDGIGIMSWNGTVGVLAEDGNRCVKAALDAYPDFYWGLATFDVMHETPETMRRQMEEIYADPRFLGLKPYPQYGISYDDPRYDCWWEFGNARHLYTGFHPVKWYQAAEFESVCKRFPNLTVVAYHSGMSYETADTVIALAKKFPNFMIEPTLTPTCCGIIDYLVKGAGVDRVMYGSDLPMRDPRQQLGWIVFSRLSLDDKRRVLGLNAQRLIDGVRQFNGYKAPALSTTAS